MNLATQLHSPKGTFFALAVAIVVAAALLANTVLVFAWAQESRAIRQRAEAVAAQAAASLSTHIRLARVHGERLASEPALRIAVATGTTEVLREAQQQIADEFPAAESVKLLTLGNLGIAAPDFSTASLSNNLETHMAGEAFNGASAVPEVFQIDQRWVLAMAFRIPPDAQHRGGVILLRLRLDELLGTYLLPENPEGQYSLWSTAGGANGQPIVTAGPDATEPDTETYTARTGLPALRVGFKPSSAFLDASSISALALLAPICLGTAILLALLYFAALQLRAQLQRDARGLREMGFNPRANTLPRPDLHFTDLEPVIGGFERRHKELLGYMRKSRNQPPAASAPADDSLDIEVVELPGASVADAMAFEQEPALHIPEEIFRDYDIRGHSEQFSKPLVDMIGRAIGSEALKQGFQSIVVGADGRESSPALREQLVRGLLACGIDVIDIGIVATPMLYFACHHLQTLSGVMVTGSHHPREHNGFKIMIGGEALCGERITALRTRIAGKDFVEGQGSYRVTQIDSDYTRAVCNDILVGSPFKVVIDCANGAASVVAVDLFQELGCEVVPLFCELDGRFPNHAPDPSVPANLRQLAAEVAASGADVGIAFDGDGDRLGIVTKGGRIIAADRLMMIFAKDLLAHQPGADIVFDVNCSRDLATVISSHGGRPIMWRSGHSWIKQKMKESGALLGGEFTGHICFRDRWFGFDDGLYAAARLLEIMSAEGRSLDAMLAELPRSVSTAELIIPVAEKRKFELMSRISEKMEPQGARLTRIDGVRAEFPDGWGLVRASNTSPALACRFEAENAAALVRIQRIFREEILRLGPGLQLPF